MDCCGVLTHETELVMFRTSLIDGTGAFAKRKIPKGARIIEYVGEKISKAESLKRCEADNVYIFTLNDECDLDGDVGWNPAKYINHSCSPNCEAQTIRGRIWIIALRRIEPGEEITFNYGYDLENYKEHPCRCGAPNCVGYIVAEEFFEHVRRQLNVVETGDTRMVAMENRNAFVYLNGVASNVKRE